MKSLSNDQKEQIMIYPYDVDIVKKGFFNLALFTSGVNTVLESLGYVDRLRFDFNKEILVWSTIHEH